MSIDIRNLTYIYNKKTPFAKKALDDVSLYLEEKGMIAFVGRTGSGKSTIISHLNALLVPDEGELEIGEFVNSSNKKRRTKKLHNIRKYVGLVFQFPEYQLFESTVLKDVAFGPKNFGLKKGEAEEKAKAALKQIGLDESFYERSPFELSGGEKRKVALAGILAMEPKILVVDEPTSGLDPYAAKETMALFRRIKEEGTTVIIVTHDMDIVSEYCDEVVVMSEGKVVKHCLPYELYNDDLEQYSLQNPHIFTFANHLKAKGLNVEEKNIRSLDDLIREIKKAKGAKK